MANIIQNASLTLESLSDFSPDQVEWVYNALDCCVTHEIFSEQGKYIDPITSNTEKFSYALLAPVVEMSLRGTCIDDTTRTRVLSFYRQQHSRLRKNLNRIVEEGVGYKKFNYASYAQVGNLLYDVMGFKEVKGRSTIGTWSRTTDRDALEKVAMNFLAAPICNHIIALRELDKKITFLQTPLDNDGRMRTSFNVAGTKTGRLSSSENDFGTGGNNQNIERRLRQIFIPDEGMKFCNVDLEQADARNVGAICWETFVESHGEEYAGSYLNACESGDLHTLVSSMVWTDLGWTDDPRHNRECANQRIYRDFTYRDFAKKLGHGTNYYATARTAAANAKVSTSLVSTFQEGYFGNFPVIGNANHAPPDGDNYDNWHQYVRVCLEANGLVITPHFNRRRYFYGRPDDDTTLREAIAYAPQSMTADEIDTGIINVWRAIPSVHLLIQVHDSILLQYPEDREEEIIPKILDLLTIRWPLKRGRMFCVPVEAKIGWNWWDQNEENPFGLTKWKGPGEDKRERPKVEPFTIQSILDEKC